MITDISFNEFPQILFKKTPIVLNLHCFYFLYKNGSGDLKTGFVIQKYP